MRTRVKICGITNLEDAFCAIDAGADALGFVMYAKSPRFISIATAADIVSQLPPFVSTVGLFVNESKETVENILRQVKFDLCQFHGDESEAVCLQYQVPYMKAIRVKSDMPLLEEMAKYPSSQAILLDAFVDDVFGGTGKAIEWAGLPELANTIVLAGGLNPANVTAAIKQVRPYAVDVSTGVEISKGKKDRVKIQEFLAAVSAADQSS